MIFYAVPGSPIGKSRYCRCRGMVRGMDIRNTFHEPSMWQELYELLFPCFNQLNEYCKLLLSCHVCCHGNLFRFTLFFNGLFGFDLPRLATTIFVAKLFWRVSVCLAQFLVDQCKESIRGPGIVTYYNKHIINIYKSTYIYIQLYCTVICRYDHIYKYIYIYIIYI